jgi:uncharacterized membrane protein YbjE (DUF340 family)
MWYGFSGFVLMNSLGTAIGNAFLVINIRGYINWKNLPEEKLLIIKHSL